MYQNSNEKENFRQKEDNGENISYIQPKLIKYQSTSSDEVALLKELQALDIIFTGRTAD